MRNKNIFYWRYRNNLLNSILENLIEEKYFYEMDRQDVIICIEEIQNLNIDNLNDDIKKELLEIIKVIGKIKTFSSMKMFW